MQHLFIYCLRVYSLIETAYICGLDAPAYKKKGK